MLLNHQIRLLDKFLRDRQDENLDNFEIAKRIHRHASTMDPVPTHDELNEYLHSRNMPDVP